MKRVWQGLRNVETVSIFARNAPVPGTISISIPGFVAKAQLIVLMAGAVKAEGGAKRQSYGCAKYCGAFANHTAKSHHKVIEWLSFHGCERGHASCKRY